jgi:hypothetical protein
MNVTRRNIQPHSPISTLLAQLGISERKFHDALKRALKLDSDSGINSLSNFSRLLKEEENLDMKDVEPIGQQIGPYLALDGNIASQIMLAEHWIWRNEQHGLLQPEENFDVRAPVVRHEQFSKAVKAILYQQPQLVTICAANEKQVGRNAFALSVGQYCAFDVPPPVRRTLRIVSLAQLDSDKQIARPVDELRVAGLVSIQIGIARRNGDGRENEGFVDRIVDSIAESLRYLPNPLLLIKDAHGVPDTILRNFVNRLFSRIRQDSPLIALVTSEMPLFGTSRETNINLDYMTPEEAGAFLVWKTGVPFTQLPGLIRLCSELKREVRKPSVVSLLAGAYLLDQFGKKSPSESFPNPVAVTDQQGQLDAETVIRKVVKEVGHGRSIESLQQDGDVFVGAIRSDGATGKAIITDFERALLFSVAIFDGRFSEFAAQACFRAADVQNPSPGRVRLCKQTLDRLCLSGLLTCEHLASPMYFSLEGDVKTWLRVWRAPNDRLRYDKHAHNAKRRYFDYLELEITAALDHFRSDPHAIDTASRHTFARLEPEARQIDLFLVEIWSLLKKGEREIGDRGLPTPALIFDGFEELSEWERQIAWLGFFCANVALFWEAANLPGTAICHLTEAEFWLGKLISDTFKSGCTPSNAETQLRAIRAQLVLCLLCIEVRQGGSGLESARWKALLGQAKQDLDGIDYVYGDALYELLDGMIRNRQKCTAGIKQMDKAARLLQKCTTMSADRKSAAQSLRMFQERQPVSPYLAFMVQREIARAQLRAGLLTESVNTDHTLLRAAKMTRESRVLADTLIALTRSSWFKAVQETERPLTEEQLSLIRQFLFQIDAYVADLPIDKTTLKAHYLTLLGIYNFEKGLADLAAQKYQDDHIEGRRIFGEDMFATGLSQVTDTHFRSVYFAFMADAYLRFSLVSNTPVGQIAVVSPQKPLSRKQERQLDRATPHALAASYLIRSLEELQHEIGRGYSLSMCMKDLFRRIYLHVPQAEIEAAIIIRCTAQGNAMAEDLKQFPNRYLKPDPNEFDSGGPSAQTFE